MKRALALVVALAANAAAEPVRVTVECQQEGRTKACPAFLLGFIDANKAMLQSPRSNADVVVYATANEVALVDRLHLRFVGAIQGAPPVIELDVDLDTRGTDDEQRAQLEPAFLRGMALYVAARYPGSVKVTIDPPEETEAVAPVTTPWGISLSLGGSANRTERYRSENGYGELELTYTTKNLRGLAVLSGSYGKSQQPPLFVDGTRVSLDTRQWSTGGGIGGGYLLDPCWSVGVVFKANTEDPKGQYHYNTQSFVGVEWDKYPADDPRGNRLAILYKAGAHVERYNLRNEDGERFAAYPYHALIASGSLRKDKVTVGVSLTAQAQMFDPKRRHSLSASPFVEVQIGGHVDLSASFSITKRELPGPDPVLIDEADYATQSRLSYAEPLALNGSFNLTIHWDRTNGARNDRLEDL